MYKLSKLSLCLAANVLLLSQQLMAAQLTAPANGSSFPMNSAIRLAVDTGDLPVRSVEFLNWGQLIATDDSFPFEYQWQAPMGGWQISARVTDLNGVVSNTNASSVSVYWSDAPVSSGSKPEVQLRSPVDGLRLGSFDSLSLQVDATDADGTVTKVEYFNWGQKIGESTEAPFDYHWQQLPVGGWQITAKATDNQGNVSALSNAAALTVFWQNNPGDADPAGQAPGQNQLPSVSISTTQQRIGRFDTLHVAANAADADGTVSKVEFYNWGTLIATDDSAPFELNWEQPSLGDLGITAKAIDNAGGKSLLSNQLAVTVLWQNHPGEPLPGDDEDPPEENPPPAGGNNQAPTISFSSPQAGQTVGMYTALDFVIEAADADGQIDKVRLLNWGSVIAEQQGAVMNYRWDQPALGGLVLTAQAVDDKGAVVTSTPVEISVHWQDNQKPQVQLQSPLDGDVKIAPQQLSIAATASDPEGRLDRVEFYVNQQKVDEKTSAPFVSTYLLEQAGTYLVQAKAVDHKGLVAESAIASFSLVEHCEETDWAPLETEICTGQSFVQRSSCGTTRTANGAKACSDLPEVQAEVFDATFGKTLITPADAPAGVATAVVRASTAAPVISPLIYGTNNRVDDGGSDMTDALSFLRLGGNRWTAYNWENNYSNAGVDWFHQNDTYLSPSQSPGDAILRHHNVVKQVGAPVLMTMPITDYLAADKNGPVDCADPNRLQNRFVRNNLNQKDFSSVQPDTSDAVVYQGQFVRYMAQQLADYPRFYSMDNEPDLWHETHPCLRSSNVSYLELLNRNIQAASLVKALDPEAQVFGSVNYGYSGFIGLQHAPDSAGKPIWLSYYLQEMKKASLQRGSRLLDVLDIHFYPEAVGGGQRVVVESSEEGVVQERVQAARSLWDDSYKENSWIAQSYLNGPIRLIPWLKELIDQDFPGTRIAITEYYYGGGKDISGALAQADVLGVYGAQGVYAANLWPLKDQVPFAHAGLRMFRNFDKAGSHFADVSLSTVVSDNEKFSVHAAIDSTNSKKVTLVVINKMPEVQQITVQLHLPELMQQLRGYRLDQTGGVESYVITDLPVMSGNTLTLTLPERSVSTFELTSD
jgi:hypothetical protein